MYIKKCWKYLFYLVFAITIIILFFLTATPTSIKNETVYYTFAILKVYDIGAFVALIVGILAFLGTIYSVEKNYKAIKLSSLPDKSANLLIDLEFAFNEYEVCKKFGKEDEFILLIEILKYWKDHQKAFRLLTPHFYKEFLKIITIGYHNKSNLKQLRVNEYNKSSKKLLDNSIENQIKIRDVESNINYSNDNATYILKAIIAQITNIAFDNDRNYFSFIKPDLIEDSKDIKEIGANLENYTEFKITKLNFIDYINNINGDETRNLTNDKFTNLNKNFKNLLKDLKSEIEEYE